jgi:hypothetical protein
MRNGPGWFLRMLAVVVVVGVLMSLAFGAGVAADGGSIGTGWVHSHAGACFPGARLVGCLFGLFLLLALLGLVASVIRGPHWRGGPGYYGGPGWHGRHGRWHCGWYEEAESMLNEWHRRAHGESDPGTDAAAPAAGQPKTPGGKAK